MNIVLKVGVPLAFIAIAFPVFAQTSGGTGGAGSAGTMSGAGSTTVSGSGVGTGTTGSVGAGIGTNASVNSSFNSSWDSQNSYWRDQYRSRPYYTSSRNYSIYEPAYRYGVDLYNRNPGKRYEDLDQSQISTGWSQARGSSGLGWSDAQQATRDAYNRMYENRPGSANSATSGSTNR